MVANFLWLPGINTLPPGDGVVAIRFTRPCTHCLPGRPIGCWSMCSQEPPRLVFHLGLIAQGRHSAMPSKLPSRSSVSQMAAKDFFTLGTERMNHCAAQWFI